MDISKYQFREVRGDDARAIFELTKEHDYNSDNLPQNFDLITEDVHKSVEDFEDAHIAPASYKNPLFIFVLEDTENSKVVGVSLIKEVSYRLLYSFHKEKRSGMNVGNLALQKECRTFELGGFLLSKNLRGKGLGKLLSYGRLLFLLYMDLSSQRIVTGFRMANDFFWDWVGKDATNGLSLADAYTYWREVGQLCQFLKELPARFWLAESTELAIHPDAVPARHLLEKVGFRFLNEIEANGSLWYGASWEKVRRIVARHRISSRRICMQDCRQYPSCAVFAIAKDQSKFSVRPVFAKLTEDGVLHFNRSDLREVDLKQVFCFK